MIDLNEEWIFINSEMKKFSQNNVHHLIREVLYAVRVMLYKYSVEKELKMKLFYKMIYIKSKKYYLKLIG